MAHIRVYRIPILITLAAGAGFLASNSLLAQQVPAAKTAKPADVNGARIANADREPGNWLSHGRTYNEQRFSPLKIINDKNVTRMGLAWHYDLDTRRGQEATPLVVDGVMYFSTAWSKVVALQAATGKPLWTYDPKVPPEWAVNACCDVVNRGVAIWGGKVFVGTLDGRLVALDAVTGKPVWEKLTIDPKFRYTITGAPRVVKGKVLIGNGGAEMNVRGYISAYDAETGNLAWRFYTVPGDPSKPFESPILEKAAKTWTGEWWKNGGGGTVWDAMAYDPQLDLLYIGSGNGDPWARKIRNSQVEDNLLASSIIALRPDTGEYVWHYQENPGDEWDYDSAAQIILADLQIDGQLRKVLLHAPKNGFFYVLDRATGKLLSAKPFVPVTWATGIDLQTGRPIESPEAQYEASNKTLVVSPGPGGAHTWQPASYSPDTGLVYFPVLEAGFAYKSAEQFSHKALAFNTGTDPVAAGMPQDPNVKKAILGSIKGRLSAWDPVRQVEVWRADRPGPWNGGALSTAGNLVFEGTGYGQFEAFRANTGEKLWSASAQSGIIAGPISYTVNGEQYVAVLAGWGGVMPLAAGEVARQSPQMNNVPRMLAFKLGGKASLPPAPEFKPRALTPPRATANPATVKKGEELYQQYCSNCHGDVAVSGGVLPDLRYSATLKNDTWFGVVMDGMLKQAGMVAFAKELSRQDAAVIREYVIYRANQSLAESSSQKKP
ncbi:MAG: PQQ-dependent dehydrogenase, methanol/ethanol family [Acidobacteriia bacterium]|nr:PQQ-dependent dehydrogenase, methanol/ethanol family [Terriglobia bacterium]